MQILFRDIKKEFVKVQAEGLDDLWTLYNIIQPGDIVKARTFRRVVLREGDTGERKPMVLEIHVENVEFHEYSNRLRIKGTIMNGPDDYVSIGQYHTINVEVGTRLSITKEKWFKHEIRRLEKSTSNQTNKIIIAVAIETGYATIGLISNYSLSIAATIRHNIPGKRYSKQNVNIELKNFFEEITNVLMENIKKYETSLVIICGPGFLKEQYQELLKEMVKKEKISVNSQVASASSGTTSAINEILRNGTISTIVSDHRVSQETAFMEQFIEHLGKDDGLCTYGLSESNEAAQMGAIEDLLVTDQWMRTLTSDKKRVLEELFNLVERNAGHIHIMSTLHPAGETLQNYSGIAAILRYKFQ